MIPSHREASIWIFDSRGEEESEKEKKKGRNRKKEMQERGTEGEKEG